MALFDAIHSVDRPSICEALAKEINSQNKRPELFVQLNTGEEPQKAGIAPGEADAFIASCREKYGLVISGLMCIPPVDEAPAPHFALTAKIAARNGLKNLSMGMSADFAVAIQFGATHVRVGSAIFGHAVRLSSLACAGTQSHHRGIEEWIASPSFAMTGEPTEPHRHLSEHTEISRAKIAGLNRQRRVAGAGGNDLAGFQRHAKLAQFVGEPGQCDARIAQHILAVTDKLLAAHR